MDDLTHLRVVGEDDDGVTPESSSFTLPVTSFLAEFDRCTQSASGDKKITLSIDRLYRYTVDELADVGLVMEFVVTRRPVAADQPDHPSRPRPRGAPLNPVPESMADEPIDERPAHSSIRTGRRKSGQPKRSFPSYPVPGVDDDRE